MTRYYHATPKNNLYPIMEQGIVSRFDGVYCSTSEETAVRWICFTRREAEEIVVLPFDRPEGDERMSIGVDHSPMMTNILGVSDEGASFVSSENIPMTDIDWEAVMVYKNPFYSHPNSLKRWKTSRRNRKNTARVSRKVKKNDASPRTA